MVIILVNPTIGVYLSSSVQYHHTTIYRHHTLILRPVMKRDSQYLLEDAELIVNRVVLCEGDEHSREFIANKCSVLCVLFIRGIVHIWWFKR